MDWGTVLAVSVPALVGIMGFVAGYINNLRLAKRKDQLERVNRQLSELYGPLLALTMGGDRAWQIFRSKYRSNIQGFWDEEDPPTEREAETWRTWMAEVFMPLNVRGEDIVVTKADLLETTDMPPCLLDLVAHVESYKAILAQWKRGDFSENISPLPFPRAALNNYAIHSFKELKARQQRLLES